MTDKTITIFIEKQIFEKPKIDSQRIELFEFIIKHNTFTYT